MIFVLINVKIRIICISFNIPHCMREKLQYIVFILESVHVIGSYYGTTKLVYAGFRRKAVNIILYLHPVPQQRFLICIISMIFFVSSSSYTYLPIPTR